MLRATEKIYRYFADKLLLKLKEGIGMYDDLQFPLEVLKGKHRPVILLYLCHKGTSHFSQLQQALGLSGKVLAEQLRHLEMHGMLMRISHPHSPAVGYSVTELGLSFLPVLEAILAWGQTRSINARFPPPEHA